MCAYTHTEEGIYKETITRSPFFLFSHVYELTTANTEFADTQPLLPAENTGLDSCEPLVTTFLCVDQYTTLFHVCFCLKTPDLM